MTCQGFLHSCDSDEAVRYRMHTQYVNEDSNYMDLCPDCRADCDAYWKEMWEDYYSSQGIW